MAHLYRKRTENTYNISAIVFTSITKRIISIDYDEYNTIKKNTFNLKFQNLPSTLP